MSLTAADRIRTALGDVDPGAAGNALDIAEADVRSLLAERDVLAYSCVDALRRVAAAVTVLDDIERSSPLAEPPEALQLADDVRRALRGEVR